MENQNQEVKPEISDLKPTIKELLEQLALARENVEVLETRCVSLWEDVLNTNAGQAWNVATEALNQQKKRVTELSFKARFVIIEHYELTGDRKAATGAGIRVSKGKVKVTDQAQALLWAKKNAPIAVIEKVDEKAVIRLIDGSVLPEWATRDHDRVTATISKDLSSYLAEEEAKAQSGVLPTLDFSDVDAERVILEMNVLAKENKTDVVASPKLYQQATAIIQSALKKAGLAPDHHPVLNAVFGKESSKELLAEEAGTIVGRWAAGDLGWSASRKAAAEVAAIYSYSK